MPTIVDSRIVATLPTKCSKQYYEEGSLESKLNRKRQRERGRKGRREERRRRGEGEECSMPQAFLT